MVRMDAIFHHGATRDFMPAAVDNQTIRFVIDAAVQASHHRPIAAMIVGDPSVAPLVPPRREPDILWVEV